MWRGRGCYLSRRSKAVVGKCAKGRWHGYKEMLVACFPGCSVSPVPKVCVMD